VPFKSDSVVALGLDYSKYVNDTETDTRPRPQLFSYRLGDLNVKVLANDGQIHLI